MRKWKAFELSIPVLLRRCTNTNNVEDVDKMLNIEVRGPKSTDMDVQELNPLCTSLRTLKPFIVEKLLDSYKRSGVWIL